MMEERSFSRAVPLRALFISLGSLAVPVFATLVFPEWAADEVGMLLWLTALVPAFLLTYYRGWQGASLALAAGMAVLSSTQVILLVAGISTPNWDLVLVVVLLYLAISLGIGYLAELLHRERRAAQQMALTDPLTELPNRRHARIFLEAAYGSADRGIPLSVVFFDLDHFKAFNDTHGHAAGDEALKIFSSVLADSTRRMDLSARWGGEEFLSVLSDCDLEGAISFANRVRQGVREMELPWGPLTVSAGIATHAVGMRSPELLVAAADRALYLAKDAGRDCVRVTPGEGHVPGEAVGEKEGIRGEPSSPAEALKEDRSRNKEKILVVDDNEEVRRGVRRALQWLGYEVVDTGDPTEAVSLAKRQKRGVDLLVTDIVMPDMSGFSLVDRLLRIQPSIRVLYMSGYSHDEVSWGGVPGSVTDFLEKPMSVEVLAEKVRRILDRDLTRSGTRGVPPQKGSSSPEAESENSTPS